MKLTPSVGNNTKLWHGPRSSQDCTGNNGLLLLGCNNNVAIAIECSLAAALCTLGFFASLPSSSPRHYLLILKIWEISQFPQPNRSKSLVVNYTYVSRLPLAVVRVWAPTKRESAKNDHADGTQRSRRRRRRTPRDEALLLSLPVLYDAGIFDDTSCLYHNIKPGNILLKQA